MVTKENIQEKINDLKSEKMILLESLKEADFSNRLDYLHDKAKLEDFCHICDNTIVSLNKANNPQEFILDIQKLIDSNISTGKVKDGRMVGEGELIVARRKLPASNDGGGQSMSDKDVIKKGRINGRIVAYTEIRTLVDTFNSELAKDNAKKQGIIPR